MTDISKPAVLSRATAITEKDAATDVRAKFIAVRESFIASTGLSYQDGLIRWIAALNNPALEQYLDLSKEVQNAITKADVEVIKAALDETLAEK